MAANSVPLNQKALDKLAEGFKEVGGASSAAYKAVVSAASSSPYFADMLNEFASRKDSDLGLGKENSGTSAAGLRISIDRADLPGTGSTALTEGQFAQDLAHELGHVLLPNGQDSETPTSPDDAVNQGQTNEGVAITAGFIVAKQLGEQLYTDDSGQLTPALSNIAEEGGIDVSSIRFNSPEANAISDANSAIVSVAGALAGANTPSGVPNLNYDEHERLNFLLTDKRISPGGQTIGYDDIDWGKVTPNNFSIIQNNDGTRQVTYSGLPLKDGTTVTGSTSVTYPVDPVPYDFSQHGDPTNHQNANTPQGAADQILPDGPEANTEPTPEQQDRLQNENHTNFNNAQEETNATDVSSQDWMDFLTQEELARLQVSDGSDTVLPSQETIDELQRTAQSRMADQQANAEVDAASNSMFGGTNEEIEDWFDEAISTNSDFGIGITPPMELAA